jgi:hypothetical protein
VKEIAVCAMFRDSMQWHGRRIDQVGAFFRNWEGQARLAGVVPTYHLLEGDSRDDTRAVLQDWAARLGGRVRLTFHDVGGRPPSSDGGDDRRKVLAAAGNVCLASALDGGGKLLLWTESDLLPTPPLLPGLLEAAAGPDWDKVAAVAPVALIDVNGFTAFYDGWAFEGIHGEKWGMQGVPALKRWPARYRPMRAIGSCALLNADVLRENNIDFGVGCFPALCQAGRDAGAAVYCDVSLDIYHPSEAFLGDRWV